MTLQGDFWVFEHDASGIDLATLFVIWAKPGRC